MADDAAETTTESRKRLNLSDTTLLVLGAVIGADIYIVSAIGARLLGPAQLVVWVVAGALAGLIALTFVQCAMIDADVGGSYAYARAAFGSFVGFLSGYALYIGEWVALPVFPLGVVQYLAPILPGGSGGAAAIAIEVGLIVAISALNVLGVRQSASINDILSVAKLVPLGLLVLLAAVFVIVHPHLAQAHLQPFAPHGWSNFGRAMLPIFWAYAGFELAVLPSGEVVNPKRTLPRALLIGMVIATAFYLFTSAGVVVAVPSSVAGTSTRPLADAMRGMLDAVGGGGRAGLVLMSAGAIVSIIGVYDVFTLGLARLSYALARDGLFPAPFARLHSRFGTPYIGILFQAASAVAFVTVFNISGLISTSVLFLSVAYFLTATAALRLSARQPERALRIPGLHIMLSAAALASLYLASQATPTELEIAAVAILGGVALYLLRTRQWRAEVREARTREHEALVWERRIQDWLLRSVRRRGAPPRRM